jgi:aminoglycoside 6-adenylyltransferase
MAQPRKCCFTLCRATSSVSSTDEPITGRPAESAVVSSALLRSRLRPTRGGVGISGSDRSRVLHGVNSCGGQLAQQPVPTEQHAQHLQQFPQSQQAQAILGPDSTPADIKAPPSQCKEIHQLTGLGTDRGRVTGRGRSSRDSLHSRRIRPKGRVSRSLRVTAIAHHLPTRMFNGLCPQSQRGGGLPHPYIGGSQCRRVWTQWYGSIVEKFRDWAEREPGVRAAFIVGSQARAEQPADEWSDLDIVIFHNDPARLIESTDWFQSFGSVVLSMIETTAVGGSRERRVLYSDGKDVDFAAFATSAIPYLTGSPEGLGVLSRGFVVLIDKDHRLGELESLTKNKVPESIGLPTEAEFLANVSDFLYHLLWVAKKLRRGETWTAKMGCDGYLKRLLVRMIEWNTVATASTRVDVWHDGRFLDQWAPANVRAQLPAVFSRYDSRDLSRALGETGRLYSRLAHQVAGRFGWKYPTDAEVRVWELVHRTVEDGPTAP